jgi:nitrite reductase/ring-hydroxylating ferredoxin subunit
MPFERAARLAEIPKDRGLRVRIGEIDLGLYRVEDSVYAMEDACPHAGFPLSRGHFENCVIVCEAHGWPFDVRTGFAPQDDDGFPIPCFATRIEGDFVEVDVSTRLNDPRRRRLDRRARKPA